jgi:preprotein translocase subunit Sss1
MKELRYIKLVVVVGFMLIGVLFYLISLIIFV